MMYFDDVTIFSSLEDIEQKATKANSMCIIVTKARKILLEGPNDHEPKP